MAALGEVPFGRYYGSVDATPLFVMLAGHVLRAHRRSRDHPRDSGRTSRRRCSWIDEWRRSRRRRLRRVCRADTSAASSTRAGRTPTTRSSTPTAGWPRARSRCARCRATSTRPSATPRRLARGARLRRRWPTRSTPSARALRRALRGGVLVRGPRHLRAGAGRRQAAVPGAHLQRRPLLFAASRSPSARPRVADALMDRRLLLGLGHSHGRRRRGALQPDVVSQRLGLAARQRADRARASPATA